MAGIAILCSGQGKQTAGMLEGLRAYPAAMEVEQTIRDSGVLPPDFPDPARMFVNEVAQPLICLYQAMAWAVIAPELPEVELFAGYSLGELSAYGCAGMLETRDVLRLAVARGKRMSAAAREHQGMVAVLGLTVEQLAKTAVETGAHLAIRNGVRHLIFGLPAQELMAFQQAALAEGASRVVSLPVTVAAHTPLQAEAAVAFLQELKKFPVSLATAPVLAGISAERVNDRSGMLAALSGQIQQTIDWQACLETALACGCRVFLELGPGSSLVRMLHEEFPSVEARSLSEFLDLKAAGRWAAAALQRQ